MLIKLAHFFSGLIIMITIEKSYLDAHLLVTFSEVSYCYDRERVFIFVYDTKEKDHQNTRQSDLHSGATPPRTN
jgi:hypothetical protein